MLGVGVSHMICSHLDRVAQKFPVHFTCDNRSVDLNYDLRTLCTTLALVVEVLPPLWSLVQFIPDHYPSLYYAHTIIKGHMQLIELNIVTIILAGFNALRGTCSIPASF